MLHLPGGGRPRGGDHVGAISPSAGSVVLRRCRRVPGVPQLGVCGRRRGWNRDGGARRGRVGGRARIADGPVRRHPWCHRRGYRRSRGRRVDGIRDRPRLLGTAGATTCVGSRARGGSRAGRLALSCEEAPWLARSLSRRSSPRPRARLVRELPARGVRRAELPRRPDALPGPGREPEPGPVHDCARIARPVDGVPDPQYVRRSPIQARGGGPRTVTTSRVLTDHEPAGCARCVRRGERAPPRGRGAPPPSRSTR